MAVVDNLDSHDDACVADKSQHYESNGSSKQRDVEQMLVRLADAFVRTSLHTVPVNWRLVDEPHVVSMSDLRAVNVYVSSAEATVVGCRPDAAEHDGKSDADNCWLPSPGWPATEADSKPLSVLVIAAAVVRALLPYPFRNKMWSAMTE